MISSLRYDSRTFYLVFHRGNKILAANVSNFNTNKIHCNNHIEKTIELNDVDKLQNSQRKENPYYIENGLRKVYPYHYQHLTHCKKRWLGRSLIDVLSSEIGLYPRKVLEQRILLGFLKINGKVADSEYKLKMSDVLVSNVHRHELPVLAASMKVLFEDDKLLVIDKPPSIPVHPCGLYRYNSAKFILEHGGNWKDLHVIHRLDRLTSGVLIFAKNAESSREIHEDLDTYSINKEYVCRVEGEFPDGVIMCNKPLKHFYSKIGISHVHPGGKISISEFKKISFNGKSSVVKCKLHTGRTHQIRAHLQYLGYPILNDSIYNSYVFGPEKGKHGKIQKGISKLLEDLFDEHSAKWFIKDEGKKTLPCDTIMDSHFSQLLFDNNCFSMDEKLRSDEYKKDPSRFHIIENCFFCENHLQDPKPSNLFMFLHALQYTCDKWEFQSNMPIWASDDWDVM